MAVLLLQAFRAPVGSSSGYQITPRLNRVIERGINTALNKSVVRVFARDPIRKIMAIAAFGT